MNQVTEQPRPNHEDIITAHQRISMHIRNTRIAQSDELNKKLGCEVWSKCENQQETGAFKLRGASNAILHLRERGIAEDVATHSSGNHGAALARAAKLDGRKAYVVMPRNAVPSKIEAVRNFGGKVILCEPTQQARENGLADLVEQGFIPIPPYDHIDIIAGQGTAALELLTVKPDLEILMTPVGGGGLISGSSIIARHMNSEITIIGAEPIGAADTAASFSRGARVSSWNPDTMADGLRALVGEMTFPIILDLVDDILTVTEAGLLRGMELIYEYMDMIIEPSSATVIAALLEYPSVFAGKKVGLILSGGNIDTNMFPAMKTSPSE
ncbi:MAG: threonine dehydratase [Lysobacterales bacterium]|jgi:threonine dehydratase